MRTLVTWLYLLAIMGIAAIGLDRSWGADLRVIDWGAVPKSEIDLWHYVSFPLALNLGGQEGHINAVRLK